MAKDIRRSFITLAVLLLIWSTTGCLDSGGGGGGGLGKGHDFGGNNTNVVVAMGDSITAGGFSGGAPWPTRLAGMIGKTVVNDGIPGARSATGAERVNALLAGLKPGFVIIFYGANDAIKSRDPDAVAANLDVIVAAAQANQSLPILATVMPMSGGRLVYNGSVDAINERIRSIAGRRGVPVVNLHGLVRGSEDLYLADGLHLNDTGELAVAMEFADLF